MVFCTHVSEIGNLPQIPQPLPSNDLAAHLDPWQLSYITDGVDQAQLFDIALAANYLAIQPLLALATARIAVQIKGKPVEEVRHFFRMDNDFTPEEEARARQENQFARDYF